MIAIAIVGRRLVGWSVGWSVVVGIRIVNRIVVRKRRIVCLLTRRRRRSSFVRSFIHRLVVGPLVRRLMIPYGISRARVRRSVCEVAAGIECVRRRSEGRHSPSVGRSVVWIAPARLPALFVVRA